MDEQVQPILFPPVHTCMFHEAEYVWKLMQFDDYRRYRRGKNRCKKCGLKTTKEAK